MMAWSALFKNHLRPENDVLQCEEISEREVAKECTALKWNRTVLAFPSVLWFVNVKSLNNYTLLLTCVPSRVWKEKGLSLFEELALSQCWIISSTSFFQFYSNIWLINSEGCLLFLLLFLLTFIGHLLRVNHCVDIRTLNLCILEIKTISSLVKD